jgi:hypothetical protein
MNPMFKKFGLPLAAVVLAMQHGLAQAQSIGITYAPVNATSIPTLSEWAMLGLALLLAAVAIFNLRNKTGGKPLASIILVTALALGGMTGNKLMEDANAMVQQPSQSCNITVSGDPWGPCNLTSVSGGTIYTYVAGIDVPITNTTAAAQKITAVVFNSYFGVATPLTQPQCVPGVTVLQPQGTCYVRAVNQG